MSTPATCPVSTLQPLPHPGPRAPERRTAVPTRSVSRLVELPAGAGLPAALDAAVASTGATSAQVELLGGTFGRISYCHPAPATDGRAAVGYSQPAQLARTPARLVSGSATVGFRDGERFVHCHAVWLDAEGQLRGGHLWPDSTIGAAPMGAVVHALDAVDTTNATDAETLLPVFTPAPRPSHGLGAAGARRAVMTRLAPAVELTGALTSTMVEHGMTRACLDSSLGSLVGAVLRRPGGSVVVPGPATEVVLGGWIDLDRDEVAITALAVDADGAVHSGVLVPGENIVAVTAEVLVEERAPGSVARG